MKAHCMLSMTDALIPKLTLKRKKKHKITDNKQWNCNHNCVYNNLFPTYFTAG